MTSTAPSTALTAAPPCPWWCTATPEAHECSHDHFGGRIGLHHRNVGGFTLYATERIRPGGGVPPEVVRPPARLRAGPPADGGPDSSVFVAPGH